MLYLTRKIEESIIINNNIRVKVISIARNSVKLGIEFPKSSTVLRKEIHDIVVKQNMEAMESFDNADESINEEDETEKK